MFPQLRSAIEKFVKLTDDEWGMLVPHLKTKELNKHGSFAKEGKVANEIGFVLEGALRHYYTKDGEEKTTYFYFEGHFVSAYISCITRKPSLLTIEALSDCTLVVFPYTIMEAMFEASPTWQ